MLGLYLGSRMLPGIALIVPLYLSLKNLGLLDHLSALIVTYVIFLGKDASGPSGRPRRRSEGLGAIGHVPKPFIVRASPGIVI